VWLDFKQYLLPGATPALHTRCVINLASSERQKKKKKHYSVSHSGANISSDKWWSIFLWVCREFFSHHKNRAITRADRTVSRTLSSGLDDSYREWGEIEKTAWHTRGLSDVTLLHKCGGRRQILGFCCLLHSHGWEHECTTESVIKQAAGIKFKHPIQTPPSNLTRWMLAEIIHDILTLKSQYSE